VEGGRKGAMRPFNPTVRKKGREEGKILLYAEGGRRKNHSSHLSAKRSCQKGAVDFRSKEMRGEISLGEEIFNLGAKERS